MEQDNKPGERVRMPHATVDAIVAAVIFAIGVVMIVDNYRIGAGWASDGPEAGYFPLRIGAIICVCSAVVLAQLLFGKSKPAHEFVTWDRLKPVLLVLGPTVLYVAATQLAGIYIASAIFIGGFMRIMGKYSWVKTLSVSLGVVAVMFWMFELQFMVPLPKGPLDALFTNY
jgi:putative tricarboxylic transport membrane protein